MQELNSLESLVELVVDTEGSSGDKISEIRLDGEEFEKEGFERVPLVVVVEEEVNEQTDNNKGIVFPLQVNHHQGPIINSTNKLQLATTPKIISNNQTNKRGRKYECLICGKTFGRQARLNSHTSLHTGIRGHKCQLCPKSFATGWDLTKHNRIHTRDMACDICGTPFTTKLKLERHKRLHTGEKPFECSLCLKRFADKRNLCNHLLRHNRDTDPGARRPYRCAYCPSSFIDNYTLQQHFNLVHSDTPPPLYQCPFCSKGLKWKANYNRHVNNHRKKMTFLDFN